jgi:F0F1-type ATP synthase epsilon subunit
MNLEVITPLRTMSYEIAWLELNTDVGNFVIQKGHAPTLLILKQNDEIIFRLKNGKQESIFVPKGIAEIIRETVSVVIQEVGKKE